MQYTTTLRYLQTLTLTLGLMINSAQAADPPLTPEIPPAGTQLVDAAEVQKLQTTGAILVDARKAAEYADATIKGALSVPYDPETSTKSVNFDPSQDKYDLSPIPDKNKTYIVFCNASACWKSFKLVTVMARAGYTQLHWYRNGFPDWKARNLPIE